MILFRIEIGFYTQMKIIEKKMLIYNLKMNLDSLKDKKKIV